MKCTSSFSLNATERDVRSPPPPILARRDLRDIMNGDESEPAVGSDARERKLSSAETAARRSVSSKSEGMAAPPRTSSSG
eukprot:CAMPEP_0194267356 /NCGR_PEP_ID=MMETSP0169-20130528/1891_1 /TAXON_ID=218684 /ORGANISM="Corethron pennatum, Strain L29A3" /LENGTH=79 /DNA_ID=CAMNT_0039008181 /DNA_START=658 /DNA_END=897 /DNA_ORIENTATION=-